MLGLSEPLLGPSWGHSRSSYGSWEPHDACLGSYGNPLEASWAHPGSTLATPSLFLGPLWPLRAPFSGHLRPSWGLLERYWCLPGISGGLLIHLGRLEFSWGHLGATSTHSWDEFINNNATLFVFEAFYDIVASHVSDCSQILHVWWKQDSMNSLLNAVRFCSPFNCWAGMERKQLEGTRFSLGFLGPSGRLFDL